MTQLDAASRQTADVPEPATRGWQAARPLAIGGGIVLLATVALHFRDPHQSGSWGVCPLYAMTGVYCPGCGGLRAVNDLSNADVGAALSSNVFVVALMPFVVLWWGRSIWNRWHGKSSAVWGAQGGTGVLYAVAAIAFVFAVVRNTPWGAWLAP